MFQNRLQFVLPLLLISTLSRSSLAVDCKQYGLETDKSNELRYQLRGDRCEGAYLRQVSSSVAVSSFLFQGSSNVNEAKNIRLTWPVQKKREVFLRATSTSTRTNYRMDKTVKVGISAFEWPRSILKDLGISIRSLGFTAWFVKNGESIFIPVAIASKDEDADKANSSYQISIVSGRELDELYVTIRKGGEVIIKELALDFGYYPENEPVFFGLDRFIKPTDLESGVYGVEVLSRFKNGGHSFLKMQIEIPSQVHGR